MENKKERKPILDYIDNRVGMIIGFTLILLSFIGIMVFYLVQAPTEKSGIYMPTKLYKSLFFVPLLLAVVGFGIAQAYLLRTIKSLRAVNKWTWRTKSKLQKILITIPSWLFFILLLSMFAIFFFSGMTMSSYGYNSYNILYITIFLTLTPISFGLSTIALIPWLSESVFQKLTSKYK